MYFIAWILGIVEEGNAGDRKRKALEVADREKMDAWMLEDINKVLFLLVFS